MSYDLQTREGRLQCELDLARQQEYKALQDFNSDLISWEEYDSYCKRTDELQKELDAL